MRISLSNGFSLTNPKNLTDDEIDQLVAEARSRCLVIGNVRAVEFGPQFKITFNTQQDALDAQAATGWKAANDDSSTLAPHARGCTLLPGFDARYGHKHPAIQAAGMAWTYFTLADEVPVLLAAAHAP